MLLPALKLVSGLPVRLLQRWLGWALGGRRIALCLHRVYEGRRPGDAVARMSHTASDLDELIRLLVGCRPELPDGPWLTVTLDDGYAGAADYLESRAPRLPGVEWLFFVCPAKTEKGVGFRWDLYEWRRARGAEHEDFRALMTERLDVEAENEREDLRQLTSQPEFRLAGVEQCRRLQTLANVALGNHTDAHFKPALLAADAFRLEISRSLASFERLFGSCEHFAFPFGHPGLEFDETHVRIAREAGPQVLWTTEAGPYRPERRRPGAVLPRFPIDGRLAPRQVLAWILLVTLKRGLRPRPQPVSELSRPGVA